MLVLVILGFAGINRFGFFSLQESFFYLQKLSIYFLHAIFIILLVELFWTPLRNPDFQPSSIYLSGPVFGAN